MLFLVLKVLQVHALTTNMIVSSAQIFEKYQDNKMVKNNEVFNSNPTNSLLSCCHACSKEGRCNGFNFCQYGGTSKVCELFSRDTSSLLESEFSDNNACSVYTKKKTMQVETFCLRPNINTCNDKKCWCKCANGKFMGKRCQYDIGFEIGIYNSLAKSYVEIEELPISNIQEATICFVFQISQTTDYNFQVVFDLVSPSQATGSAAIIARFTVQNSGYRIDLYGISDTFTEDDPNVLEAPRTPACIGWSFKDRKVQVDIGNKINKSYSPYDKSSQIIGDLDDLILRLGRHHPSVPGIPGDAFDGRISYFMMYNRLLNDNEMKRYQLKEWVEDDSLKLRWNDVNFDGYFNGNISVQIIP